MGSKLGIGIIGCGGVSEVHGAAFMEFSDVCQVVAVCDTVPAKALSPLVTS